MNQIAILHWAWVRSMNWHNKNPLEYIALIGSEVGAAADECRGDTPSDKLPEKLADIILRTLDFAEEMDIDMDEAIKIKMDKNRLQGNHKNRLK